jgi:hypothetical protein
MGVLALFKTLALSINYKQFPPLFCIQNTFFSYYIHAPTLVPKCIYVMFSSKIASIQNSLRICSILSICQYYRNPTLAKCGGEAQHLEKVRIWSPPGLPNV